MSIFVIDNEYQPSIIMKSISTLCIFTIMLITSCGDARFVLNIHNDLLEEFETEGTKNYVAEKMIMEGDREYCTFDKRITRLNNLVPNDSIIPGCNFSLTYEYITKLRTFIKQENDNLEKKLIKMENAEYYKIDSYFDSLHLVNTLEKL